MKIISWNVNGYRAAWKKGISAWLDREGPDILCIQETKSWTEQLDGQQLNPVGYSGLFTQPDKKGYSGVATFSQVAPVEHRIGYGIQEFDSEGRVMITRHGDILLANIYFPNGKKNDSRLEYKMRFYEATLDYFGKLDRSGENLIVVGDYNTAHKEIDLARPKENEKVSGFLPQEREWIDRWVDAGFVDIFRKFETGPEHYTWWDQKTRARERNVGWRIDYFFVNERLAGRVKGAWISPEIEGSDHCPLGIEISAP